MPASKISLVPDSLDLALYAGDGATIKLTVIDNASAPLIVDGEVIAQIRRKRLDSEALLAFAVDLTEGSDGVVFISLTGEQTASLIVDNKPSFTGVWDVQWRKTGKEPITLVQGAIGCVANVSR
jgi:hypothetical protein